MADNDTIQELIGVTRELVDVVSKFVYRESIKEYQGADTTYPDMQRTLSALAERLDSVASTFEQTQIAPS